MFLLVGGLGWDETGFFSQGLSDGCSQGVARSWIHLQVLPTDPLRLMLAVGGTQDWNAYRQPLHESRAFSQYGGCVVRVAVAKKMRWKLYGFYRKLGRHIAGLML